MFIYPAQHPLQLYFYPEKKIGVGPSTKYSFPLLLLHYSTTKDVQERYGYCVFFQEDGDASFTNGRLFRVEWVKIMTDSKQGSWIYVHIWMRLFLCKFIETLLQERCSRRRANKDGFLWWKTEVQTIFKSIASYFFFALRVYPFLELRGVNYVFPWFFFMTVQKNIWTEYFVDYLCNYNI